MSIIQQVVTKLYCELGSIARPCACNIKQDRPDPDLTSPRLQPHPLFLATCIGIVDGVGGGMSQM